MFTRLCVAALLVDQGLVDQVWEAWGKGEIDGSGAYLAWLTMAYTCQWKSDFSAGQIGSEI